jgi:hypothetical protein
MLRVRFIRADAPPRKRAQTSKNILKGPAKNALHPENLLGSKFC